jgi:transcriptional regulator with XRE-family HTH domain
MRDDDAYGATVAKRRLARILTDLRKDAGWTANQVCDKLQWGRGKVGRFEANSWVRPEMSDVRDLLRLYEVPDERQRELEELAVRSRVRGWWRDSEVFTNEFPGFEADASCISVYMPLVLPGLLQTAAYIQAQLQIGTQSTAWRKGALATRLRRQKILDRPDETCPELRAVITEASLMYRWGTQETRREQVTHLVEMSQRPNVEVRLLRFADGPHPGMGDSINLFDFPEENDLSLVYMETEYELIEVDEGDRVETYREIFDRIRAAAAEPAASTDYLKQLAESLE